VVDTEKDEASGWVIFPDSFPTQPVLEKSHQVYMLLVL